MTTLRVTSVPRRERCGFPQLAVEVNAIEGAIDHGFQFMRVLYFTPFGEALPGSFRAEPGGMTHRLIGPAQFVDFHQESFDYEFLHAAGLPEHALGVNVEM